MVVCLFSLFCISGYPGVAIGGFFMRGGVLRLGGGVAASDCPDVGTNVLGCSYEV